MTAVAVILPVYNEVDLVDRVFADVAGFAQQHRDYHFIFVDDGSSDGTADQLRQCLAAADDPRLGLIAYHPNGGKGHAIRTAVRGCHAQRIIFTDGDLAYSLDHLPRLVEALETHEVVIGSRSLLHEGQRNIRVSRKIMGWIFNRCARLILNLPYPDTQAGLKGFRRDAAGAIFSRQRLTDFSFDVELVYLARRLGYRIGQVPAHVSATHSYKVSRVNMLRDPLRMFIALWRIRFNALRGLYG
ncbi:MAG: glycosyltransferase [Phycisphaeraceae bacterium]